MLQNSIAKVTQAFGIQVLKLFHAATEARYRIYTIPEPEHSLIDHQVIRTFLGTFSFT